MIRPRSLLTHLRGRYRLLRRRGHNWLESHPRLRSALHIGGCLRTGPEPMARGIGVGLFIGLTPTVGFQTVLMVIGCIILRGNFPAAFAVSWVSNPVTLAPLYWAFHRAGEAVYSLIGLLPDSDSGSPLQIFANDLLVTSTGALVIATPVAGIGYFLASRLTAIVRDKKP